MLNLNTYEPSLEEMKLLDNFEQVITNEIIENNALLYIAGYVAHRFRHIFPELGIPTKDLPNPQLNNWLCLLSRGNCIYPSDSFIEAAVIMEQEFQHFHGTFFNKHSKIFDILTDIVCTKTNNKFPKQVIACLVRTRTYIRLRKINKDITQTNYMKKSKKLYKMCNKKSEN